MILEQLADRVSAAIWNLHPGWAVAAGKHQYDGQVPDLSAGAIEGGLERLGSLRRQLDGLDGLTPQQEGEREVLGGVVDRERFEGETALRWQRDPGWYLEALDVSVYLERDYAPAGLRLERAAAVLGEAGALLGTARANLSPALPVAWVEAAVGRARRQASGLAAQVESSAAARAAPQEAAWVRETAGLAASELEGFAAWLDAERRPASVEEFALGSQRLEEWLLAAEGLGWTAGEAATAGAAALEEDREALAACTSRREGPRPPEAAAAPGPLAALRKAVEEAHRFARDKGLCSLDGHEELVVASGSRPEAGEAGWLQSPGPYDDPATRPVLYLGSGGGEPGPSARDDLAVSLACPGRLPAALHAAGAAGEARRRFPSRGFLDGWALYAGDLMAEAGFWAEYPHRRLAALQRAIREDCRLIGVARLHGGGMAPGDAAALFSAEAGTDAAGARVEALRCAADPGCASAGLGRAVFRRLRRRWGGPAGEPPAGFHHRLLSASAWPLGLVDRLLP